MTTPGGKMPLRDWFAGQVLAGWTETHHGIAYRMSGGKYGPETMAQVAYAIADAMIAHGHPPKRCGRTACDEPVGEGRNFCDEHTPY